MSDFEKHRAVLEGIRRSGGGPYLDPRAAEREAIDAALALIDEQADLCERLKQEAKIHAQEARSQTATVHEIYQLCTGASGEPGDWNGTEPVRKALAERDHRIDEQAKRIDSCRVESAQLRDRIAELEAQVQELNGIAARERGRFR